MRHLLMDPAFPDLVGELARESLEAHRNAYCANDNGDEAAKELSDPLLIAFARAEIAATRCW